MTQATKRIPSYALLNSISLQLRSRLTIIYDLAEYFAFRVGGK